MNLTAAVAKQVEDMVRQEPGVAGAMSVIGYSMLDGQVKSNAALLVLTLAPSRTARRMSSLPFR